MTSPDSLVGTRIRLRNYSSADAPVLQEKLKDLRVTRFTHMPHPYKLEHARQFLARAGKLRREGDGFVFAIEELSSGEMIGAIGTMHIDWPNRKAEFGYWLAESHWGKGLAQEAVRLFLKFAFDTLKIVRLYAHVFAPNAASHNVLLKCGFTHEGILRQSEFIRGRWLDNYLYSLLRDEYKRARRQRKSF
jgi:[ribosomal protein S5]-alanine N-acetyltransferase